ncbi:hypothetical protein EDD86DRAFT_272358 [Gorgonomyces haynaldii]|nr:hypothetical protein EDD86DRAFT_272358 [Gorgonomyces haynaldii]
MLVSIITLATQVFAGQFITGPCNADADCDSKCCQTGRKVCRAILSLQPGVESCLDGRTPNFDKGAKIVNINDKAPQAPAQGSQAPAQQGKVAPGTQFITGPCNADADCASTCCQTGKKICRAVLSLQPGVESCLDGRTPNFERGSKIVNINDKAPQAPAQGSQAPAQQGKVAPGTQFITGPCNADADCASTCCQTGKKICRAVLSLQPGVESCLDGRTPNFERGSKIVNINDKAPQAPAQGSQAPAQQGKVAPGTQFITGPCNADADCASTCCQTGKKICRAVLSLQPGVESCLDGRTPNFDKGAKIVQI